MTIVRYYTNLNLRDILTATDVTVPDVKDTITLLTANQNGVDIQGQYEVIHRYQDFTHQASGFGVITESWRILLQPVGTQAL